MPLKTEPLEEPSINLTSMLDVVMLLIIFFMVGTKFSEEERQTSVQVPTATDKMALSGQPDEIVVNVSQDGQINVRGEAHSLDSLQVLLTKAREGYPGQGVVIRGDGRGNYQPVMDVLSTCKLAGIRSVSLAHTTNPQGK